MQEPPAWSIALQHSSCHSADTLCRLLCVSKPMRSMVLHDCVGQVPASISLKEAETPESGCNWELPQPGCFSLEGTSAVQLLGRWLTRYGRLLKTLTIRNYYTGEDHSFVSNCIAASVSEAANNGVLHVQSAYVEGDDAGRLTLKQLSCQHLTRLHMQWPSSSLSSNSQLFLQTLTRLSKLQQLNLEVRDQTGYGVVDPLLPAIAPMVQLTRLNLGGKVQDLGLTKHLPHQLQDLEIRLIRDKSDVTSSAASSALALQLGHLTSLTRLASGWNILDIRQMDVLPQTLKVLKVTDCSVLQPILHLCYLQRLSMDCSTTPAHEPRKLSQLTALTHVSLQYSEDSGDSTYMAAPAAAGAWSALNSLSELIFSSSSSYSYNWAVLKAAEIQGIQSAKTLQDLSIAGKVFTMEAAAALPAALRELTALTRLRLNHSLELEGYHDAEVLEEHTTWSWVPRLEVTEALACSIASLHILCDVCLDDMCIPEGPATLALSRATQLTYLSASYCFLTDEQVVCMIADMTALQGLRLNGNENVTVASAPTIARLTQLTSLDLLYTSEFVPATRDNLRCLTSLQHLQDCSLPGDLKCWWIGKQTSVGA